MTTSAGAPSSSAPALVGAWGSAAVAVAPSFGSGVAVFRSALAGLVVTIAGDLTLIPAYGLVGAAVASSAAYTVKAFAFTVIFLVTSDVSLPQLVGWKEYGPDLA